MRDVWREQNLAVLCIIVRTIMDQPKLPWMNTRLRRQPRGWLNDYKAVVSTRSCNGLAWAQMHQPTLAVVIVSAQYLPQPTGASAGTALHFCYGSRMLITLLSHGKVPLLVRRHAEGQRHCDHSDAFHQCWF